MSHTFVFDVGKTNVKSAVLDAQGRTLWRERSSFPPPLSPGYRAIDIEALLTILVTALERAAKAFVIGQINVSTHGACAALLDRAGELLFPVMDYEFDGFAQHGAEYDAARPPFSETFSPRLGAGLNLGRQLWWLKAHAPARFARVHRVLLLPQYFVWRLTGRTVSEVTSLGCHTDLWEPGRNCFSSMVHHLGLAGLIPEPAACQRPVGPVLPDIARRLGLPSNCVVFPGIHDSNASLARYLSGPVRSPFSVVSTGTWIISMAIGGSPERLDEARDMLCNVSVTGEPVPCARFMGGREYEHICSRAGATSDGRVTEREIEALIEAGVFAIPPFEVNSGPFRHAARKARVLGQVSSARALATLYLALMIDHSLTLLDARGPILFGSIHARNPLLCRLVGQLRPAQDVLAFGDEASTVMGAWLVTQPAVDPAVMAAAPTRVPALELPGLAAYRTRWLELATAPDGRSPTASGDVVDSI